MIPTSKVSLLHTFFLMAPILSSTSSIASLAPEDEEKSLVPYNAQRTNLSSHSLEDMGCDLLGVGEMFLSCITAYYSHPTMNNDKGEEAHNLEENHPNPSVVSTALQETHTSSMNPFGFLPLLNPTQIYELTRDKFMRISTSIQGETREGIDVLNASINDGPSIFWPFWNEGNFSPFSISDEKKNQ